MESQNQSYIHHSDARVQLRYIMRKKDFSFSEKLT